MSSSSSAFPTRTQKIQGRYGFAQVADSLCLVQFISSPAPQMYQVHIFHHTFVSLFSYVTTSTISGKSVLQVIDHDIDIDDEQASSNSHHVPSCRLEPDTGIVFVSQEVMARYVQLKDLSCPGIGFYKHNNSQRSAIPLRCNANTRTGKMSSGAFIPSPSPISMIACHHHKRVHY